MSIKGNIISIGIFLPITPVEEDAISEEGIPKSSLACDTIVSQSSIPCSPVKQFALPLLITIAESLPSFKTSFVWVIGAATTLLDVNTPAALLFGDTIIDTPYLPSLNPAACTSLTAHIPPSMSLTLSDFSNIYIIKIVL